jgi:hypothetical protein
MDTLEFARATRSGNSKTERHYLDFVVSRCSLKELLGKKDTDLITPVGWGLGTEHVVEVLTLRAKSELKSGRVAIYVCPECGDIGCGAITANVQDGGSVVVWSEFGYETDYGGLTERYQCRALEFDRGAYLGLFSTVRR